MCHDLGHTDTGQHSTAQPSAIEMITLFHYACECDDTNHTLYMLLSAASGAAMYRLYALCAKHYQQRAADRAARKVCGGLYTLGNLACHAALVAEQHDSLTTLKQAVNKAVSKLDSLAPASADRGPTRESDPPGPNYASDPLIPCSST